MTAASVIQATALDNAAAWSHYFGRKAKQLHPGQVALADHPAKEKYASWGRRCGKSIVLGEVMIPRRAMRDPGIEQRIFSKTHDQARIIFEYAATVVTNSPLEVELDRIKWSPPLAMIWKNGSTFYASGVGDLGANTRGHGSDVNYIDEAAFIKDRIVAEAIDPMLAASRFAETVNISTPNGLNWFYHGWTRGWPGNDDCKSFQLPSWANPFINRSFLRGKKLSLTSLAWAVEYAAEFRDDQAAQFPWSILEAVLEEQELPVPAVAGHKYVIGYDPADTADRSGVVVLDRTSLPYRIADCLDISRIGYIAQKYEIEKLHRRYYDAPVLCDASHMPLIEEIDALGVLIQPYRFSNTTKRELIDNLRLMVEQRDVRIPYAADDLISEMTFYRREKSKTGTLQLGAPEDGYDDLTTAFALAAAQAGLPSGEAEVSMMEW